MRLAPEIDAIWDAGGPFIGPNASNGYVTVEPDWALRTEDKPGVFIRHRLPVRWFQKATWNPADQIQVPGIKSVNITRSLAADAAECEITILNVLPRYNDPDDNDHLSTKLAQWGEQGGLTLNHGQDAPGIARWGHKKNEWFRRLAPGALVRTYEGYGGRGKTWYEALTDGNVVQTGAWRVDTVTPASNGDLTLRCRDMAGLLIDQPLYPPLLPEACYPTNFFRYRYSERKVENRKLAVDPRVTTKRRVTYVTSSSDKWFGHNAYVKGHRPSHSIDGSQSTYWLSEGNSHPSRPFCVGYLEYAAAGQTVNAISMRAWRGNYTMYVSVMVDGRWQGADTIPYDHTPLLITQPGNAVDTGADIPYVARFQVPWEQMKRFRLPKTYRADRIRITFRNHTKSDFGPWFYRVGVREFQAELYNGQAHRSWVAMVRAPSGHGYWAVSDAGDIQGFGDAAQYPGLTANERRTGGPVVAACGFGPNGLAILTAKEKVFYRGGSLGTQSVIPNTAAAIAANHGDAGFWTVAAEGNIKEHAGAPFYTGLTPLPRGVSVVAAASHPTGSGLWILTSDGKVHVRGDCNHYGHQPATGSEFVDIDAMPNATGYYLTTLDGQLHRFGSAPSLGSITDPNLRKIADFGGATASAIGPTTSGVATGMGTLTDIGFVAGRGAWTDVGHPAGGTAEVRKTGNYTDLADIVKLILLWSGFYLKGGNTSNQAPAVHGAIESTGFAPETPIGPDFFDKKPGMEVIKAIRDLVGYCTFVDHEGGFRFSSPNWWQAGNFLPNGTHINYMREIDEKHNLISLSPSQTLKNERSEVIVSDGDPMIDKVGVRTARWKDPTAKPGAINNYLRGVVTPMMIPAPLEMTAREMRLMAQLIGIHLKFKRRSTTVQAAAHPSIELDDQVRIWERTSSEQFVNYVHSISTSHDFESGVYTMDLQTYWLGEARNWVIKVAGSGFKFQKLSEDDIEVDEDVFAYATRRPASLIEPDPTPSQDIDEVVSPDTDGVGD